LRRAVAEMDEHVNAVATATADLQDKLAMLDERLSGVADELKAADRHYDRALERLATIPR
jgi:outer membrane murein-binding lipoprotein Lpp